MSDNNEQDPVVCTVEIDMPNKATGLKVQIPGLGTFENGNTYEITESEQHAFQVYHTRNVPIVGDHDEILGSETKLGPTLAEAAQTMYGVKVTDSSGSVPQQTNQPPSNGEQTTESSEGGGE